LSGWSWLSYRLSLDSHSLGWIHASWLGSATSTRICSSLQSLHKQLPTLSRMEITSSNKTCIIIKINSLILNNLSFSWLYCLDLDLFAVNHEIIHLSNCLLSIISVLECQKSISLRFASQIVSMNFNLFNFTIVAEYIFECFLVNILKLISKPINNYSHWTSLGSLEGFKIAFSLFHLLCSCCSSILLSH